MHLIFIASILFLTLILWKYVRLSIWREKWSQQLPCRKPNFFNPLGDGWCLFCLDSRKQHINFFETVKDRFNEFKNKSLFICWITYSPFVFVNNAEAAQELLKGMKTNEKSWVYRFFSPMFGDGLLLSGGEKWKLRRKMLSHCFHSDILKDFQGVFNDNCQKLADFFQGETNKEFTSIDIYIKLSSLDMICESMFGAKVLALENSKDSDYAKAVIKFCEISMARIYNFWLWPDFIFRWSKTGKEFFSYIKTFQDFSRAVLKKKKAEYLRNGGVSVKRKRKAMMDLLLERHMEFQDFNEDDITEEVDTFILEGFETIATSINWILFLIGLHPDIQAKLHEEVDRVLGKDEERPLSVDDLNKLNYMECVIKEVNRIYTVVPIFGRQMNEDIKISGYTIPKGAACLVLNYYLHRDESVFPDPEKFDPDRFLPENASKIPDYGFLPFSAGPRNCIGKVFAMLEMKTILCYILRRFTLKSLDGRDKVLPLFHITLNNSIPIRIQFRNRTNGNSEDL